MNNYQSQIEDLSLQLIKLDNDIASLELVLVRHPRLQAYLRPAIAAVKRTRVTTNKMRDAAMFERKMRIDY